jgi:hypothetical protein
MTQKTQVTSYNDLRMLVSKRRFIERVINSKNEVISNIDRKNIIYEKDIIKSTTINSQLSVLQTELSVIIKFIRNYD